MEQFPEIWDYRAPSYKDNVRKLHAWQEIVRTMESSFYKKFSEGELSRVWRNMRDTYRRKRRELYFEGSGSAATNQQPWPYLNALQACS
ncbi:hypothetical protein Q1695_011845 [Nippostrongylus brasiliensis]|nr:hypothetical protein Q1695_011845 [Nippostrongylus brasiliensis]